MHMSCTCACTHSKDRYISQGSAIQQRYAQCETHAAALSLLLSSLFYYCLLIYPNQHLASVVSAALGCLQRLLRNHQYRFFTFCATLIFAVYMYVCEDKIISVSVSVSVESRGVSQLSATFSALQEFVNYAKKILPIMLFSNSQIINHNAQEWPYNAHGIGNYSCQIFNKKCMKLTKSA